MSMNAEWEKFFHVFSEYTVTLRHGPDNVEQVTVEQLYKAFSERYVAEAIGRWAREGEWDQPEAAQVPEQTGNLQSYKGHSITLDQVRRALQVLKP